MEQQSRSRGQTAASSSQSYRFIYYLLRSGAREEAYYAAQQADDVAVEVKEALRVLAEDQRGGPRGILGREQTFSKVRDLKEQQMADQTGMQDNFEEAVLNLLSFANPSKYDKEEVVKTTEDYLWFSLWFTQYGEYKVDDVAKKMLKWGPKYFDPQGRRPLNYARVLFCCQLFQEGVYYLQTSFRSLEAVHMAIIFER